MYCLVEPHKPLHPHKVWTRILEQPFGQWDWIMRRGILHLNKPRNNTSQISHKMENYLVDVLNKTLKPLQWQLFISTGPKEMLSLINAMGKKRAKEKWDLSYNVVSQFHFFISCCYNDLELYIYKVSTISLIFKNKKQQLYIYIYIYINKQKKKTWVI